MTLFFVESAEIIKWMRWVREGERAEGWRKQEKRDQCRVRERVCEGQECKTKTQ